MNFEIKLQPIQSSPRTMLTLLRVVSKRLETPSSLEMMCQQNL